MSTTDRNLAGEPKAAEPNGDLHDEALAGEGTVRGERAESSVSRVRSLQSRASTVLAGGLTMVLGVGALTWYYANALTRPDRARDAARAAAVSRAQGEMPLPPLGHIPLVAQIEAPETPGGRGVSTPAAPPTSIALVPSLPLDPVASTRDAAAPARGSGRSASQGDTARRLAGPVLARASIADTLNPEHAEGPGDGPGPASLQAVAASDEASGDRRLGELLRPTPTAAVRARVLPTRRFLLPKGAFIDCTLETAIDSTLPGMTTCITATDTYSADGRVVLLERGTKLIGETRGQVQQGSARVFVLWVEARTPTGVVVPLDSPGTDELGRAGLSGRVERHFWERFGAAMLITTIDAAVQSAVQSSARSGGTVIYNPGQSENVLTEVLRGTVGLPPTIVKKQGDRIEVLVARDVDFTSVYELRH